VQQFSSGRRIGADRITRAGERAAGTGRRDAVPAAEGPVDVGQVAEAGLVGDRWLDSARRAADYASCWSRGKRKSHPPFAHPSSHISATTLILTWKIRSQWRKRYPRGYQILRAGLFLQDLFAASCLTMNSRTRNRRHHGQAWCLADRPAEPIRNHSSSPACSDDIARAACFRTAATLIPVAEAISASGRSAK